MGLASGNCKTDITFSSIELQVEYIALFTLHKLTWVRPRLKLTQVSCGRVYTCAFQICSVNEIWDEPRLACYQRVRSREKHSKRILLLTEMFFSSHSQPSIPLQTSERSASYKLS